jgi:RNA polymerase sigma-70 factor (ECF subfamily)
MTDASDTGCEDAGTVRQVAAMTAPDLGAWFLREVLPLEAALTQYLHRNWRVEAEVIDIRQDVYVRVCEAAQKQIPDPIKPLLFTIARNLLIDRVRKKSVVPIEAVADLDALGIVVENPGADRSLAAREELRRLQVAIDDLPPRCREAVVLARLEGLSGREIAQRMGISEQAVSYHLNHGVRLLANALYSEPTDHRRRP